MDANFLQGFVLLLLTAIGAIAGLGIKLILKSISDLRQDVKSITEEITYSKTWRQAHDQEDERRFGELKDLIEAR